MLNFLAILAITIGTAFAQNSGVNPPIPVPETDPGIPFNRSATVRAPVVLEAFIELNCGDSAYAFGELSEVAAYYGSEQLDLIVHQLPLPYHRNAFLQSQGLYLMQAELPDQMFNYMDAMLSRTLQFSTGFTRNMTEYNVIDMMADVASQQTGIDRDLFANEVNDYIGPTVNAWKYGTRRGMAGTPMFVLNNVDMAVNPSNRISAEDWKDIIDPLLED